MTLRVPSGLVQVKTTYGAFSYHDLSGGNVDIDDAWERANLIIERDVCGTGLRIQLHKLVMPEFLEAFGDALKRCPAYKIDMIGGYCARHMLHNPKLPLSIHSWGAAVDINWNRNGLGQHAPHDLPDAFIEAFTGRGWEWGGNWQHARDFMHFQYAKNV